MDARLELRLRTDPTGDPRHVPGGFRDRTAAVAVRRERARPAIVATARPAGALLAVVLFIASTIVFQAITGPATTPVPATPSPNPSASPVPTMDAAQVQEVLDGWVAGFGASPPAMSVTVIAPGPAQVNWIRGLSEDEVATVRIGEVSRLYLSAAVVIVDACTRLTQWTCPRPAVLGSELRLTDRVSRWYEPWPDDDLTTVAHLLEGSSGLAATSSSVTDLAERIEAAPGTDWSRQAVIARAIAAPRVFALGSHHAPTDTEGYVLEELLEAATGMSSSEIISADGVPPFLTRYFDQAQPDGLVAGLRLDGGRIADLDPAVLDLVGNAGGMTSSSDDLAEYTTVWHTVDFGLREVTDTLVDAANDHANPLAARGICCRDGEVTTIVATGHAFGWSALIAYDLELGVSVGVVAGRDISEADLEALLDVVIAEIAGTTSG